MPQWEKLHFRLSNFEVSKKRHNILASKVSSSAIKCVHLFITPATTEHELYNSDIFITKEKLFNNMEITETYFNRVAGTGFPNKKCFKSYNI